MEHSGGRGAISVPPKSVSTNINIWNIVGCTLGRQNMPENVYMHVIIQLRVPEMTYFALFHTIKLAFPPELTQHTVVTVGAPALQGLNVAHFSQRMENKGY